MARYHLVGVGGAGMSAIAELLVAGGHEVTGSDIQSSPLLERLSVLGVESWTPHDASRVPPDATLVVSSAIRSDNAELVIAKARGQEVLHRSLGLAAAATGKRFVAVAGAHGKTTTSGMLASALTYCGLDPSFAVGSTVAGFDSGAHVGSGDIFVAEADESDGSFLNYSPTCALVTNIEADHLDHFGGEDSLVEAFRDFVDRIVPGGTLICCGDDAGSAALAQYGRDKGIRTLTYGVASGCDISITNMHVGSTSAGAIVSTGTSTGNPAESCSFELAITGRHNVLNAAGAITAGLALGVPLERMCAGVGQFRGTARRFELRGVVDGKRLYDDYAHHPTEVEAALTQARVVAGDSRVVAVFQPHLYSRTLAFADRFAEALAAADTVFLADIYRAREDYRDDVTADLIAAPLSDMGVVVDYFPGRGVSKTAIKAAEACHSGDVLVLIGAGDINTGGNAVLEEWRQM